MAKMSGKLLGKLGEQAVAKHLVERGYRLIECNYHAHNGRHEEIDIIACDTATLVFVEVKTRKKSTLISAMDAITIQKCRRIVYGAQDFLLRHEAYSRFQPRFDIACVTVENEAVVDIDYYENAFSLCDI